MRSFIVEIDRSLLKRMRYYHNLYKEWIQLLKRDTYHASAIYKVHSEKKSKGITL